MKPKLKPDVTCAYCGRVAQGQYSIHRDGFGVGPEVELCDACGAQSTPTTLAIWDVIARPSSHSFAHKRMYDDEAETETKHDA